MRLVLFKSFRQTLPFVLYRNISDDIITVHTVYTLRWVIVFNSLKKFQQPKKIFLFDIIFYCNERYYLTDLLDTS